MRTLFILVLFSALVTASFNSCTPMPNGGIPFYLKIDSVKMETKPDNLEGANTQNVSDVWVEAGKYNLGAFEMPTRLPVLIKDPITFVISAGVKTNGASNNRLVYPMYSPDTFSLTPTLDTVYKHIPVFKYKAGVNFKTMQDFDFGNNFDSKMGLSTDSSKYGPRCGMITVLSTDSNVETSHQVKYQLTAGEEVWLELDYKCDVPFYVGLYGTYSAASPTRLPIVFINEKATWNKVYIKLTDAVAYLISDTGCSLYFEALKPVNSTGGKVYIDNIKVITL